MLLLLMFLGATGAVKRTALVFAVSAAVTLAGGVALEHSGERIVGHLNMTGVLV